MSYIILNDVNSNTINGLMVQALPPITKPLMRTQIDEIDGRDGDLVTDLGYSAYDKKLTIGLYKDFDIDEIVAYFTGKGTAIFSNEPDKYYEYEIIKEIDYERLLRFKVADVVFHVQPYKYSVTEGEETASYGGQDDPVFEITNNGNTTAKPTITIWGSGTVNLSLNDVQIFVITLGTDDYISINASEMEAYKDAVLKNRSVVGSYDNFLLNVGENEFTWTGDVTRFSVNNYSRWI